jgi:hypothetical protein
LNQGFRFSSRRTPAGAEFEPVFFGIDLPFQGDIPALGYAQSFQNAHGGHFRGGIFSHNLGNNPVQSHATFALHQQAKNQDRRSRSRGKDQHLVETRIDGQVVGKKADNNSQAEPRQHRRDKPRAALRPVRVPATARNRDPD